MEEREIRKLAQLSCLETWAGMSHYEICLAYFKGNNWQLIPMQDGAEGDNALSLLSLDEFAKGKRSFAFKNHTTRIVAIDATLDPDKRAYYLSHELGHIVLNHSLGSLSSDEEREANQFAEAFLHTKPRRRIKWMLSITVALAVILCFSGFLFGFSVGKSNNVETYAPVVAPQVSISPSADRNKTVYFTASGEKYHEASCPHIKGRATLTSTLERAAARGLEPCKSCLPDKE